MLFFSRPCDHDRLNAAVFDLVHTRFNGTVHVEGDWDPCCTLEYLERRMGTGLLPTMNCEGTLFFLRGKYVVFTPTCVVVTTLKADMVRFSQA